VQVLTVDSRVLPDTDFEAGYRISGFKKSGSGYPAGYLVSEKATWPDIRFLKRPDTRYPAR